MNKLQTYAAFGFVTVVLACVTTLAALGKLPPQDVLLIATTFGAVFVPSPLRPTL